MRGCKIEQASAPLSAREELLVATGRVSGQAQVPDGLSGQAANAEPSMFSIIDASRKAGLGRTTIYAEIKAGVLPAVKVGRRTLIRRVDFVAWIASLQRVKRS